MCGCKKDVAPTGENENAEKPEMLDGPGMEYNDEDYQTEYAKAIGFERFDSNPYFAVGFLGYGEDLTELRTESINRIFASLTPSEIDNIPHFSFEGDEWYLVVPRYNECVEITHVDSCEAQSVYQGEAFTVRCNPSDLYSNIEISISSHGGYTFSPQMGGNGFLITSDEVCDITDFIHVN